MITKTEATTRATAQEDAEFSHWEQKIDAALATHTGRTIVDIGTSQRVRERLMAAYRKGGWTVTFHDSQREGASLEFG